MFKFLIELLQILSAPAFAIEKPEAVHEPQLQQHSRSVSSPRDFGLRLVRWAGAVPVLGPHNYTIETKREIAP